MKSRKGKSMTYRYGGEGGIGTHEPTPRTARDKGTTQASRFRGYHAKPRPHFAPGLKSGGEGGIRTHEPSFARLPAFEAGSFNRSDTSPRPNDSYSVSEVPALSNRRLSEDGKDGARSRLLRPNLIGSRRYACCFLYFLYILNSLFHLRAAKNA